MKFEELWNQCIEFNIEQKPEEYKQLIELLNSKANKKYALEIGSNYGGTTVGFCNIFENVITIDIKHHENFDKLKEKFPNYNYLISDSKSNDTVNFIKSLGIKFDFIFIDGDHSYDGVKSDYEKYKQFLASDGHIGFHDIISSDQNKKNNINVDILWNDIKKFYKKTYEYFHDQKTNLYKTDNLFHNIVKDVSYSSWGGIGILENTNVAVFVHNYLDNDWDTIVNEQLLKLKNSGLYTRADKIYFGVYSKSHDDYYKFKKQIDNLDSDVKIEIVRYIDNNLEFNTLCNLQNYCRLNPSSYILYYHTKGSSRQPSDFVYKNVTSWRHCLEYFVIEKWKISLLNLIEDKSDLCGSLYLTSFKFLNYEYRNYYSGNFWWGSASYINTLPNLTRSKSFYFDNKVEMELWIGKSAHRWINYYGENVSSWYEHHFDSDIYQKVNYL